MKILVIALSGIGDALMFTPAAAQIKKHVPQAELEALVMFRGVEDIYQRSGLFSHIHFYDYLHSSKIQSLLYTLSLRGNYDYTISVYPANRAEYNGINYLIGARYRGGIEYIRNNTAHLGFLNNCTVKESDEKHNVQENLELAAKMFGYHSNELPSLVFNLLEEDVQFAESALTGMQIKPGDRIVGMHAGCSVLKNHINRRWEPEKFAELAKRLCAMDNTHVLLFGGPEENELKRTIIEKVNNPAAHFVATKNLAQSAALIKRCGFFVTNDSSLMHVASAMQRRVLALIGPTNKAYIYPWGTEYKIASLNLECAPCFFYSPKPLLCHRTDMQYKCIKELSVDLVWKELQDWLE